MYDMAMVNDTIVVKRWSFCVDRNIPCSVKNTKRKILNNVFEPNHLYKEVIKRMVVVTVKINKQLIPTSTPSKYEERIKAKIVIHTNITPVYFVLTTRGI